MGYTKFLNIDEDDAALLASAPELFSMLKRAISILKEQSNTSTEFLVDAQLVLDKASNHKFQPFI